MDHATWKQLTTGPTALREQEMARHERSVPPPGEARIMADVGHAAAAVSVGGTGALLYPLGRLLHDLGRVRRHARDRAAEDIAARTRRDGLVRSPAGRPHASWVMGRSARWHDPDVAAEIRTGEVAEEYRSATVLGAGAGLGSPVALLIGIWRGVDGLRRFPRG